MNTEVEYAAQVKDVWNRRLQEASRCGKIEEVKECIKHGADVLCSGGEFTVAGCAARWGHKDVLEFYFANYAHQQINQGKSFQGKTTILCGCEGGDVSCVQLLLDKGASLEDTDKKGRNGMHYACMGGHLEMMKYLLSRKMPLDSGKDKNGNIPLDILKNTSDDNDEMKQKKSDCLKWSQNLKLWKASEDGNITEVKNSIEEEGANKDFEMEGYTVAGIAASRGHRKVLKYLISQESLNINEKDSVLERTAFLRGCEGGFKPCVKFLLQKGANPDDKDKYEQNGMHYACMGKHLEVIKYLKKKGMPLDTKDKDGVTPRWLLNIMLGNQRDEEIEQWIKGGCTVTSADNDDDSDDSDDSVPSIN